MALANWDSNDVRLKWREVMDLAASGNTDIVVTRYGKPVVAIVKYEDFLALQDELDDLRAAQRADAAFEECLRNPARVRAWDDVRAELAARGKLDAES